MKIRIALLATVFTASIALPVLADDLQPLQSGSVTYISGGVGSDERDALRAAKQDYNLHIMNSAANGEFTTDDTLSISSHGQTLVSTSNVGPLFFAKLPPGTYTVTATIADHQKQQKITVGAGKPANVHFVW